MRVPFIMYIDLECLLENISTCRNYPNKYPVDIHCLHIVHLIVQKIGLAVIEVMIV